MCADMYALGFEGTAVFGARPYQDASHTTANTNTYVHTNTRHTTILYSIQADSFPKRLLYGAYTKHITVYLCS